jgi:hypothetical protein
VAAQLGEWERSFGIGQSCHDALVERCWCARHGRWLFDDFEREGVTALSEFDPHRLCRRCGAMLDGEGEIIAVAAQIEIGIAPGVELGGAVVQSRINSPIRARSFLLRNRIKSSSNWSYYDELLALFRRGPVAGLVGIEGGVVSGVFNLESPGVEAPGRRPRHDKRYHEA